MTIEHFACAAMECLKSLLLWRVWRLKNYISPSSDLRPCFSHLAEAQEEWENSIRKKKTIHTNEAKSKLKIEGWNALPGQVRRSREEKKSCKRNFILKLRLLHSNSDSLRGCAWTWNLDLFVCACADIAEMRSRGLRCFAPHSTPNSNMRFTPFVYHSEAHFPLSFAFFSLFSLLWLYLIISTSAFCLLPLFIQIFFLLQRIQTCSQSIDKHRRTHSH